ncbi:hypothetical protein [Stratiformator vulcanicus]|uniref:Uncharacterized protein n=1 Tax=Stratiformator vulcanicus TaxID=2527980 RepID=A0A517R213_9PLAN|nr:hypothetical protein [Stratiformator vulcanicus]QDT37908.1 hypothetical protein Pan189_22910 [Stratiformator vulcanicus]
MQVYSDDRVRFEYPADWQIEVTNTDDGKVVTAQSETTAFWSLALFPRRPDVKRVMMSALEAYEDDYDELDVYDADAENPRSKKCEVEFVCRELIAAARLHAFASPAGTALVLFQFADVERDDVEPLLEQISESVAFIDDGSSLIFGDA